MSTTDRVVARLLAEIERDCGLDPDALRRTGADAEIRKQIASSGASPASWAASVIEQPGRLATLICDLVVPETYFFRGAAILASIRDRVLPELLASVQDGRVVLWSAGCSTGEEAWTLAAIADDLGALDRVEVIGTDLCPQHVQRARQGVYRSWSLRGDAVERMGARIERDGAEWRVADRLRPHVRFFTMNLLEPGPLRVRASLILCRNVLVYLSPRARDCVAERFAETLLPGGSLVTSPTDPPLGEGLLVRTPRRDGVWYRHADDARREPVPGRPASPSPRPQTLPTGGPDATELRRLGGRDPVEALRTLDDEPVPDSDGATWAELRDAIRSRRVELGDELR